MRRKRVNDHAGSDEASPEKLRNIRGKKRLMVQFKIQLGRTCQCNILSALVWNLFLYIIPKYNAIYE